MATLSTFRDMKTEIGTQLSNLLRFLWKVYKRKKEKKKKKKKGKGKKGKGKGTKKLDMSKTMQLTPGRSNSFATPSSSKSPAGKTPAAATAKSGGKVDKQASFGKTGVKVTAQDNEGSIDLTTGDNENSFSYSAQELMRRETIQPTHAMDDIAERENEGDGDEGEGDEEKEIKELNEEDENDEN